MEALIESAVAAHPTTPAPRVVSELAAVLCAFPSGLSDAVLNTQLYSTLTLNARAPRGRGAASKASAAGSGNDDGGGARARTRADQLVRPGGRPRPAWWSHGGSLKGVTPLSEAVRSGDAGCGDRSGSGSGDSSAAALRHVCLHAEVVAPPQAVAWPPSRTACSGPVLYLSDDGGGGAPPGGPCCAMPRPPASLFVHSSQLPLVGGPLLAPGTLVRVATTVLPALPGSHAHMPRLMPTAALVAEVPPASWPQQLASAFAAPAAQAHCSATPIVGLKAALTAAAAAAGAGGHASGPRGVDGWLLMRVARVGPPEPGAQWGARVARAVGLDHASGISGGGDEMEVDGAAAAAPPAAVLVLRGEQQAALGDLLRPGEEVAVFGAATCLPAGGSSADGGSGGGSSGGPPLVVLGDRALVAVRQPARPLGGEPAANLEHDQLQPSRQQQQQQTVLPPLTQDALQPGARGLVVSGAVRGLRVAAGGRRLQCRLAPAGAPDSGGVPLAMHFDGGARGKALLRRLRDGHALLLIGARSTDEEPPAAAQQQQQRPGLAEAAPARGARLLEWDEAWPAAEAHDVACLPALLTTPALQFGLVRASVAGLTPAGLVTIVEARVARATACAARSHSACGRAVARASLGLGDLGDFGDEDAGMTEGSGSGGSVNGKGAHSGDGARREEEDVSCLWSCAFCGTEVQAAETELSWSGSMALRPTTAEGGSSSDEQGCEADVEPGAWRTLLPFTPEQWRHSNGNSAAAANGLEGQNIKVCLVVDADGKWTVTQALLL